MENKQSRETQVYFDEALNGLVHHWGHLHPLHSTIYCIMAHLMIESNSLQDAEYGYKASLTGGSKILGPNHIQTAEVYMDLARLNLKMCSKSEALLNFRMAYFIYLSYFGKLSLPCANAAFYIASISEEQRKLNEALEHAVIANDTYIKLNGLTSDLSISSQWLMVSVSYSLKHLKTNEYCNQLYDMLVKRDKSIITKHKDHYFYEEDEDIKERIDRIKIYLVATVILNTNRNLSEDRRFDARKYCDSLFEKRPLASELDRFPTVGEVEEYADEQPQRIKTFNYMNTADVGGLKFEPEVCKSLLELYETAKEASYKSISELYIDRLSNFSNMKMFTYDNKYIYRR